MSEIDKILERYFEGETSLQEEETLRSYFTQADVEDRHKMYIPLFSYLVEERNTANVVIEKPKRKRIPLYVWAGVAASILLCICFKVFYDTNLDAGSKSLVYVNGKRITDIQTIKQEAMVSLDRISDVDEDILDSQIDILESFTE